MSLNAEQTAAVIEAVAAHDDALLELTRALIACRTDSQSIDNPEYQHVIQMGVSVVDKGSFLITGLAIDIDLESAPDFIIEKRSLESPRRVNISESHLPAVI